jgi:hypothetical protein
LSGINIFGEGQFPGRCFQVGVGQNNERVIPRPFKDELFAQGLNVLKVLTGIIIGTEQADGRCCRISDGFFLRMFCRRSSRNGCHHRKWAGKEIP